MAAYAGGCMGRGTPISYCVCICHDDPSSGCDAPCGPVGARASDHREYTTHPNRNTDRGKAESRRGRVSLKKAPAT